MRNKAKTSVFTGFLLCPLLFSLALSAAAKEYSGLVWKRQGDWRLNGGSSDLRLGESIPQGGLVTANGGGAHSLVVLFPDGQRLLFECFEAQTCAQGFRVPPVTSQPDDFTWAMFKSVRDALLMRRPALEQPFPSPAGRDEDAANVEIVAGLEAGKVAIAPALRVLPAGSYKLSIRGDGLRPSDAATYPERSLDWDPAHAVASITITATGLYRITVVDESHVPRMEIELLVTTPGGATAESDALRKTRSTVIAWNKVHEGWSLHDFLRVYLQSRAVALTQ